MEDFIQHEKRTSTDTKQLGSEASGQNHSAAMPLA